MLVDVSENTQSYIEDCEVCCNPIRLKICVSNNTIIQFEALKY
ncbi:CPXCG motif-containing cysteine-rich protein [Pontimicrobium aquaticum]